MDSIIKEETALPKIQVLDKHTAELIAAGEVVERPASVVKELMENAIDAGASSVTVEIKNGGISSMAISDNGCGISREDVPTAFLRHATSKVRTENDLNAIHTLGFRGEALASIAAVSHIELVTRTADEMAGTCYRMDGGEEVALEDIGCPQGTVITVKDLFYNVPARMKFLKKDVSEGNSVAGVVDRVALSHPEVSVRFIRDGREELMTPGDGNIRSCIYAVFGKDFSDGLLPVDYTLSGIHVYGFVSKPVNSRANRTMQHFFINGRYVKTRTAMAALEQAFKGSIMVGKFPSCVLYMDMPPETVDANVHPAKIEVRFAMEKPVFDAVYHGVRSALETGDTRKQAVIGTQKIQNPVPEKNMDQLSFAQAVRTENGGKGSQVQGINMIPQTGKTDKRLDDFLEDTDREPSSLKPLHGFPPTSAEAEEAVKRLLKEPLFMKPAGSAILRDATTPLDYGTPVVSVDIQRTGSETAIQETAVKNPEPEAAMGEEEKTVVYIGEAFHTYIIAEMDGSVFFIDKHAAHERILYNQIRENAVQEGQMLLSPVPVALSREEYTAITACTEDLQKAGFEVDDFGGSSVLVRAVPMILSGCNVAAVIQEIAGGLAAGKREITTDKLDWIYHSTACRAAVKGGDSSKPEELYAIARRVLLCEDIRYCPHGRPVCFELTRKELEKQFGRIV